MIEYKNNVAYITKKDLTSDELQKYIYNDNIDKIIKKINKPKRLL